VDEKKDDYEVGYARPPRRTQFKQGSSGNPRGRPRGSKNLATIVRQVLDARVAVRENGRVRTISKREALFAQLVHEGLGGTFARSNSCSRFPGSRRSWSTWEDRAGSRPKPGTRLRSSSVAI